MIGSSARDSLPPEWVQLLCLLPGYDPFADAYACWFDVADAQRALDFFPKFLRHVEGAMAGKPFVLSEWQKSFIANLFGWKQHDEFGRVVRRYRESLLYVPRKNGKTPLIAGLALFVLFCDGEAGQQDYVAAADREQAGMLFRHAQGMVKAEPKLDKKCRIYGGNAAAGQSRSIVRHDTASFLRIVSADASTKHGGNSHLVVVDELHTQPNRELIDVLSTSTASANRAQPLTVYITTADYDRPSICNEKHEYASKVRDGEISDKRFLPAIWEMGKDDDWTDEKTWARCNPNLGVSVSVDYLRSECLKAQQNPALKNTFMRLHLDFKTTTRVASVIPMEQWDAADPDADPVQWRAEMLEMLRGAVCYGGLDLGSVSDLTAFVLLFYWPDFEGWIAIPWFWVPEGRAEQRRNDKNTDYLTWIDRGFITVTDGDVTDYDVMRADVNKIVADNGFYLMDLAVDRTLYGVQVCTNLIADGHQVVAFGQGFLSMAGPTRQLLDDIAAGRIHHGNNPVLRWMAGNVQGEQSKKKGTDGTIMNVLKFVKASESQKIDGIVGLVMARGRAMEGQAEQAPSVDFI